MSITIKHFKYEYITNVCQGKNINTFFSPHFVLLFFCLFLLLLSLLLSSSFIFVVIVSRLTVDLNFFRVSEITIYYRSCTDNENICVNFVFPIFFSFYYSFVWLLLVVIASRLNLDLNFCAS